MADTDETLWAEIAELVALLGETALDPADPQLGFARRCLLECLARRFQKLARGEAGTRRRLDRV